MSWQDYQNEADFYLRYVAAHGVDDLLIKKMKNRKISKTAIGIVLNWARERRNFDLFRRAMLETKGNTIAKQFQMLWVPERFQFCFDAGLTIQDIENIAIDPLFGLYPECYDTYNKDPLTIQQNFLRVVEIYLSHGGDIHQDTKRRNHWEFVGGRMVGVWTYNRLLELGVNPKFLDEME